MLKCKLLNTLEYNSFNWFRYGTKIWSSVLKSYTITIKSQYQFFDSKTGTTYKLKEHSTFALQVDLPEDNVCDIYEKLKKLDDNLSGIISAWNCTNSTQTAKLVCHNYNFYIEREKLEDVSGAECPIISYAIRYNPTLQEKTEFPTPHDIKVAIEKYGCKKVCRVLEELVDI